MKQNENIIILTQFQQLFIGFILELRSFSPWFRHIISIINANVEVLSEVDTHIMFLPLIAGFPMSVSGCGCSGPLWTHCGHTLNGPVLADLSYKPLEVSWEITLQIVNTTLPPSTVKCDHKFINIQSCSLNSNQGTVALPRYPSACTGLILHSRKLVLWAIKWDSEVWNPTLLSKSV